MARLALTRAGHFTALPRLIFLLMVPPIILAIPEATTLHSHLVHDIAKSLTGFHYPVGYEFRMGMLRAASTFEHPILYGLFCASTISLVWVTVRNQAVAITMVAVLCGGVVLSASTAPLIVMVTQLIFILGERLSRSIPGRFKLVVGFAVFAWIFLTLFSNRGPVGIIATGLTLNPQSGYYRILIWEQGIDDVLANPIFGIRPEDWTRISWMTPSVDNHWLLLGMRGGFAGPILLIAAMYLIWRRLYRRGPATRDFDRIRFGWSCVALSLLFGGATVAYFGKMQPFLFLLLGYGAALAHLETGAAPVPAETRRSQPEEAQATGDGGPPKPRTYL
jgi:hypothetical protein